jgi:hypothetical protein
VRPPSLCGTRNRAEIVKSHYFDQGLQERCVKDKSIDLFRSPPARWRVEQFFERLCSAIWKCMAVQQTSLLLSGIRVGIQSEWLRDG